MEITHLPVDTIEGIGPVYSSLLNQAQIYSVHDLLLYAPVIVAEKTGIPSARVEAWRSAALLLGLEAVDKQIAEALIAGGITSQDEAIAEIESECPSCRPEPSV